MFYDYDDENPWRRTFVSDKPKSLKTDPTQFWFITAVWFAVVDTNTKTGEIKTTHGTGTHGFCRGLEEALDAVHTDRWGLGECLYNYVVLEHIEPGIPAICKKEIWFKWDSKKKWVPTQKPKALKGIVHFAIG